jgi:hypothetical protein
VAQRSWDAARGRQRAARRSRASCRR